MAGNYIPNPDAEFHAWQENFVNYANAHLAALGIVAADMSPVVTAQSAWKVSYPAHIVAIASASAAKNAKDTARVAFVAAIRPLVRQLQASPAVDDGERAALGITVPGANPIPQGPPAGRPIVKVECARLRHTLSWADGDTPTSRAKPLGVMGAELRMALTNIAAPTPMDPAEFAFLALDTATPYVNEFGGGDGGKNAHYIARWVSTSNEHGGWSETVSVTVGA